MTDLVDPVTALGLSLVKMTPDEIEALCAALDPEEVDAIEAALAAAELALVARSLDPGADWRATPATMAHHLTRGRIRLWRYTLLLGQKFKEATTGVSTRQIWNLPARYGKSLFASQWGPTWALDRDDRTKIILVSYGDTLADENAVACRDILKAHAGLLHAELRRDRQRMDRFVTTGGGGILAAGILSGITGFGAHGAVVDDPFKNWQEAHSEARRDVVDNQYRSVIRLRLETDDAWIIVVHTRWHEDDITGRLVKQMEDGTGEAWDVVRLPAIAEQHDVRSLDPLLRIPDPLGRRPGEVLEPERFSIDAVKARHLSLGSYLVAGMEQQRPAPEEGGEIKRAWWRWDSSFPVRYDEAISSWDMKLKDKESGDYVVGQAWGRTGKDFWCFDQLRGQWDQATTTNAIALMAVRHPEIGVHVIENTGNGPEVMIALRMASPEYEVSEDMASQLGMTEAERVAVTLLRRRGLGGLVPNNPKGPKPVRARAVAPYIEAGDVHLPENADFAVALVNEAAAFPQGAHDDQVDAMSQALSRLSHGQATIKSRDEAIPKTPISTTANAGPASTKGRMTSRGRISGQQVKPPSRLR